MSRSVAAAVPGARESRALNGVSKPSLAVPSGLAQAHAGWLPLPPSLRMPTSPPLPSLSSAAPLTDSSRVTGAFCSAWGGRYYRIDRAEDLPPFLINLVSSSDLWMFISSRGSLTAGRRDADAALFPYQTVDRIHDSTGVVGPITAFRVPTAAGVILWEPFAPHTGRHHSITRRLYKSVEGDRIWFEETHQDLGLVFRQGWSTSERHGFIRHCELESTRDTALPLVAVDGLRNLLPAGILQRLQETSSNLADAYKTAERIAGGRLAVFALAAAITDRPAPLEALRASAVWSDGLPGAELLLSDVQLDTALAGGRPTSEHHARGVRGSYLLRAEVNLAPRSQLAWTFVLDTQLSQADVAARRIELERTDAVSRVLAAADDSTLRLRSLVASADGLQSGGDETVTAHHFANVLFNVMRGGVFAQGHLLPTADFARYVEEHSHRVAEHHAAWLHALPDPLPRAELQARVAARGDADLTRLADEYLPLLFSRRHGDPSRPWNRFSIRLRDEHGQRRLAYEGNWRDIFQNWEGLCLSHPEFLDAVIAKFLNASTADGFNPYRISQSGFDWEMLHPDEPWSSIGYWGDHPVIYLLKLLEAATRFRPGMLTARLRTPRYSYARVPYRIVDYATMRRDPRDTIIFDEAAHREIMDRVAREGSDARLLSTADGGVLHVSLAEKLLVVALVRFTHFVPGGGIWMNTRRPEWNDANNALVGYGVSVVTLGYLRRFLVEVRETLWPALGQAPVRLSAAVSSLLQTITAVLIQHEGGLADAEYSDQERRTLLDGLAEAGSVYRKRIYAEGPGPAVDVSAEALPRLFALMIAQVDHSLRTNRRADGLFHAYNQLEFTENPPGVRLHRLSMMLEGQVSVLSSGLLDPAEVVALLETLRTSPLYRADQHSYLLYPDRTLPGFLERNRIAEEHIAACPLLREVVEQRDGRLVVVDADGQRRFHPDLVNAEALEARLTLLARDPTWTESVGRDAGRVRTAFEHTFHHRAFTGRSGSMFGFEGLGCIYWHMVAKLLLAVQEQFFQAQDQGRPEADRLRAWYFDLRSGLGFNKSPADYGAFPTDPYSHTPGHSGAQQPGMTGQVKEEMLTRLGELGVRLQAGQLSFRPRLLRQGEFSRAPGAFAYHRHDGTPDTIALPAGSLAFTLATTPVLYRATAGPGRLRLTRADGSHEELSGHTLTTAQSAGLLARDGTFVRAEVELGSGFTPMP